GLKPIVQTINRAEPFKRQMNGYMILSKKINGLATDNAIRSAFCIATVLGATSATTTCYYVTLKSAIKTDKNGASEGVTCNSSNNGLSNRWTVGSPNQPSPSAVTVMPSWHADK